MTQYTITLDDSWRLVDPDNPWAADVWKLLPEYEHIGSGVGPIPTVAVKEALARAQGAMILEHQEDYSAWILSDVTEGDV